ARARTETADICLNCYDLAWGLGAGLTDEDQQRYDQAVHQVLWTYQAGQHDAALAFLNWARRKYQEDPEVRWAWLAHRAAVRKPGLWRRMEPALTALRGGDYQQTQALLREVLQDYPRVIELRALAAEVDVLAQLSAGDQRPSVKQAEAIRGGFAGLRNLWHSQEDGTSLAASYGTQWMGALERQVDGYRRRAEHVERLRKQLSEALQPARQTGSLAGIIKLLRDLQAERSGDEGLEIWLQAAEFIEAERAERALELLAAVTETKVSRVLRSVAIERLKQRSQRLAEQNRFSAAIELLEQVVEHCRDDSEAKEHLEQYNNQAKRYEELLETLQSARQANDLVEQAGVLSTLLRERFRYTPDGVPLADLWLECRITLVKQQADDGLYAKAIKTADDTLKELRKFGLSQEEQEGLEEKTRREFHPIDQKREQVASDLLDQAVEWMRRTDLGLNEALTRAAMALEEACRYDPRHSEVLEGVHAFRHGRSALLHPEPDYGIATAELNRAAAWVWDELKMTVRPYTALAEIGAALAGLPDPETASPEDVARTIRMCDDLDARLERWDHTVPEKWRDTRLIELHRKLDRSVDEQRRRSHMVLNESLRGWLQNIAQADAALDYQETFARLNKILPVEQVERPAVEMERWVDPSLPQNRVQSEQVLNEWGRRVRTLYNLALAQAHLLRAEMDLWRGREDLIPARYKNARRAAEAAEKGEYAGPWPNDRPAQAGLRDEIRHLLQHLWVAAYKQVEKTGEVSAGLWLVHETAENSVRDLAWLSDQYLEHLDPAQAEEAFGLLLEAGLENRKRFISLLAPCGLTDCQRRLCTYAHAAKLVKQQRYKDALRLADLADRFEAEKDRRSELGRAVVEQMVMYWERVFDRLKEGQPLAQVLEDALIIRDGAAAEKQVDALGLDAALAQLDKRYHAAAEPAPTELRKVANQAFQALDEGDKKTFARKLARVPVAQWKELRQALEGVIKTKFLRLVSRFTDKGFVRQTLLVLKGHIGKVLRPARRAAEEFSGYNTEHDWKQVRRTAVRGVVASIATLILLFVFVGSAVVYAVSPDVRKAVAVRFAPSTVTPTPPPFPQGELTVGEGELREAGTVVWYQVSIENTGEVTATFEIHPTSDIPRGVFWMRDNSSPLEGWPRVTLAPRELRTFRLVVPHQPPASEPEHRSVWLRLVVEGQDNPIVRVEVTPPPEQLEITGWSLDRAEEEYVRQVHLQASGAFTPSITGQYGIACYDGDGKRRGDCTTLTVNAGGRGVFTCSLNEGAPGEWHVAVFPLRTDEQGGREPDQSRPFDGFPYEHPFVVREPHYGLTVTRPITYLFDPAKNVQAVGLRYEIRNTGEISDRFSVEFEPITNTERLSLTVMSPGTGLTYTLELTETTGPVPLFPREYPLAPCPDPSAPDCPVVHLEIWAYYPVAPRKEGERWLLEPPVTFDLILRPQDGKGKAVTEHVEVTEFP
ncbi:MAG: hypothetical protein DRI79_01780, partial [Chloroflexi bacterium]